MNYEINMEPAFPSPTQRSPYSGEVEIHGTTGITVRDYFAAAAMTGLLAAGAHPEDGIFSGNIQALEAYAFNTADAMIEMRFKKPPIIVPDYLLKPIKL